MSIYFIQHGLSVAKEENPERPLSAEGREQTVQIAAYLKGMGVSVKTICHSGKARAEETADILASQIAAGHSSKRDGMNPNDSVNHLAAIFKDDTAYVGHLPQLEKIIGYLVVGDADARIVKFSNSGVVCLGKEDGRFFIEWVIKPDTLPPGSASDAT